MLILVDALDEAVTAPEPSIVTLLAGSQDLPRGVRFVLTSPNEPRVLDQFDGDAYRFNLSSAANSGRPPATLAPSSAVGSPHGRTRGLGVA